jgi:hypothetical protein
MMADSKEQRVCVKFCFLLGTVRNLTAVLIVRQSGHRVTEFVCSQDQCVTHDPTTEQHDTTNGYQNRKVHTMRQLPGPDYTQPQCTHL